LLSACLSKQSKPHPLALTITVVLALTSFAPAAGCEGGGGAPEMSSGLALGGYLWVIAMLLICVANLSWREPDAATSAVPNDDD